MPVATAVAPVPDHGGFLKGLGRRQLYTYPRTVPRLGYLGIVTLTTIMLYYLYYEEGALTPLMLPYYHMSFQYFLYLLVVSNAIGAFSALIGGLSDRIGRANMTIYGTLVVGLVQLGITGIHSKFGFAVAYCIIGFVEGVILVSTPALMRDFSPQMGRGAAMGFWALAPTMGSLAASLVATHTLIHLPPWQDQFIISGLACMGVVAISFFFLRELSPQLRDQLMVSEQDRALIEARARGISEEEVITASTHPFRSMLRLDLISSSLAVSLLLLFYFASVSVLTLYWVVVFGRSTPDANGINVWYASFACGTLVLFGVLSDLLRVRKALHAGRGGGLHGDDGVPHTAGRPSARRLLLQRPRNSAPRHRHRVRLRTVDGRLHRTGRVAQPRAHGHRVGCMGLDTAHRGGVVLPRPPLGDHHLHDPGRQSGSGQDIAGHPGCRALRTLHHGVLLEERPGERHHRAAGDGPAGAPDAGEDHHFLRPVPQPAGGRERSRRALQPAGAGTGRR